jgi:hypothetical protein
LNFPLFPQGEFRDGFGNGQAGGDVLQDLVGQILDDLIGAFNQQLDLAIGLGDGVIDFGISAPALPR